MSEIKLKIAVYGKGKMMTKWNWQHIVYQNRSRNENALFLKKALNISID